MGHGVSRRGWSGGGCSNSPCVGVLCVRGSCADAAEMAEQGRAFDGVDGGVNTPVKSDSSGFWIDVRTLHQYIVEPFDPLSRGPTGGPNRGARLGKAYSNFAHFAIGHFASRVYKHNVVFFADA